MKKEIIFALTQHGKLIYSSKNINDCWFKLQRYQSQSADWAIKYEGYKVTEMTKTEFINTFTPEQLNK